MDRGQDIGDNVREVVTIIRFFRGNSLNSQGKGSAYEGVFNGKDKELWHIFPNNFKKNILRNMKKEPIELKYLKKYEKGTD